MIEPGSFQRIGLLKICCMFFSAFVSRKIIGNFKQILKNSTYHSVFSGNVLFQLNFSESTFGKQI